MAEMQIGKVRGLSAYEIAVQKGYIGTEEEWIAYLKAIDGTRATLNDVALTNVNFIESGGVIKSVNNMGFDIPTNEIKTTNFIKNMSNGATFEVISDNLITVTTNTTYGTFARRVNVKYGHSYITVTELKRNTLFTGNANILTLNYRKATGMTDKIIYSYDIIGLTDTFKVLKSQRIKIDEPQTVSVDFGVYTTTNGAIFDIGRQFIVDVTNLSDEILSIMTIDDLVYYDTQQKINNRISEKSIYAKYAETLTGDTVFSKWKGKNALVIGDSITAARKWQLKLTEMLGMNVTTHAKGGIGIVAMVDGSSTDLPVLSTTQVTGKDLIVILAGYNERGTSYGQIGDVHPTNATIMGRIQYLINRVYAELANANNLTCKIVIVTPHCAGKYEYIDADGYQEYPVGSGQTMELLSNAITKIANYNNIPVCDLWHNSGINKFTWNVFSASSSPTRTTPATGTPYPNNADQFHCSDLGYARIGECIVGTVIKAYGY